MCTCTTTSIWFYSRIKFFNRYMRLSAVWMCATRMAPMTPVRLRNIAGFDARRNDIIYVRPKCSSATSVVVFFPGDVQDYPEVMTETDNENNRHTRWNLESVCGSLQSRFQKSHIAVIKPARMESKVFSCYDNFVPSNNFGVPSHVPMHNALSHLELLLRSISIKIGDEPSEINALSITLVGFSKGCVVLNQFLHEIHHLTTSSVPTVRLINRITDIYWLDGGHSGTKSTWITSKRILQSFAKLEIAVHIHMTPYQLSDARRPWIRKEEKIFSDTLRKIGVSVYRFVHFDNQPPSLENHFQVLNEFR